MSRYEFLVLAVGLTACASHGGSSMGNDGGGSDSGSDSCPGLTSGASTLAGAAEAGYVDGSRCAARFHNVVNVAVGPDGKVYVADFDNSKIRAIEADGTTSTVIAKQGFTRPFGLAFAPDGTLYVSTDNDPSNQHNAMSGSVWRVNVGAKTAEPVAVDLGRPRSLFVLKDGRIAATDYQNHVVELIDPASGAVTPLAGTWGAKGFADGAGGAAKFAQPYGIVQRADGSLVVNDWENQRMRVVTLSGTVTTMAGSTGGYADGSMADAKFNHPQGLAIDSADNLYLTDTDNFRIRKISGSTITTVAGDGMDGFADDDDPMGAEFHGLEGLAVKPDGSTVYVADGTRGEDVPYNRVREIAIH